MHDLAEGFLSKEFIFFCLAIAALTYVFRRVVEYFLAHPKVPATPNNPIWKELVLPIFPVVAGAAIAYFAKKYPFPNEFVMHSGRTIFGLVAGMLSGLVYRIVKSLLGAKDPNNASDKETTVL